MTITVVDKPGMLKEEKVIGKAVYLHQEIWLDLGCGAHEETLEQSFIHEVVHWILWMMNHPLIGDETFVDSFAHFAYQVLDTQVLDN